MSRLRCALHAAAWVVVSLWFAPLATAERPTLSELEARVTVLEGAVCPIAEDPRPLLCPGECRCPTSAPYGAFATCSETAPGTFEVVDPITYTASCTGRCITGSRQVCNTGVASCPVGEGCLDVDGDTWGICAVLTLCLSDAECAAPEGCDFDGTYTGFQGRCSLGACDPVFGCIIPGFACDGLNQCSNGTACTAQGTCDTGALPDPPTVFTIENVGEAGSAAIATCNGNPSPGYNSNDAQACIAEVESALGVPCTPLP